MSKTKTKPAPSRKRKILNFALVGVLAIATGIFLGSWYSYNMLSSNVDYGQYNEISLSDTIGNVMKEVLGIKNATNDQIKNVTNLLKNNNIKPTSLTPSQVYTIASSNLENANSFSAIGKGKVATIATQSVYSAKKFDGNTYTFESISNGLIKVAECAVMQKNADTIKTIKGNNVSDSGANWNGGESIYTLAEYKETTGNTPNIVTPYIISSKTVLNNTSNIIVEQIENEKKLYKMEVSLDPIKSVINYVKQVKHTSGLSSFPEFSSISIVIVIDEDWNFVRTEVTENYRINYSGLKPKCTGTLNTDFIINKPVELPL